jgi:polyisoprenyl-teichoic acid--peptidoglycan teichoic acid transferase
MKQCLFYSKINDMSLSRSLQIFKRKTFKFIPYVRLVIFGLILACVLWVVVFFGRIGLALGSKIFKGPSFLYSILINRNNISLKNTKGTTNVLLLGIGGKGHDGPNLTDTMILLSVNPEKKFVIFTPIPRDVWLTSINAKINAAYSIGEDKKQGGGMVMAKDAILETLGVEVHYTVVADFTGFEKAVDLLGGVAVYVDQDFVDPLYPKDGHENDTCGINIATMSAEMIADTSFPCRYETLSFKQGLIKMTGEEALKYVRSRHAETLEGTDFARSQRQQKVLIAVKDKFFSTQTLLSSSKLIELLKIYKDYIKTDIKEDEYDDFIKLFFKLKTAKYDTFVLDQGNKEEGRAGLLVNPPASKYGAWVLEPSLGDWTEIQEKIQSTIY